VDKTAKILVGGVAAGALLYGAGAWNSSRLERKVQDLQKACVAQAEAETKNQGTLSALANIFTRKMTCDPIELANSEGYTGVQGQLGDTERELLQWDSRPQRFAIFLAIVCSLPWWWYFFLRRIRELREAALGR
jgi:hypothetical protein